MGIKIKCYNMYLYRKNKKIYNETTKYRTLSATEIVYAIQRVKFVSFSLIEVSSCNVCVNSLELGNNKIYGAVNLNEI